MPSGDAGEDERNDETRRGRGEDAPLPQTLGIAAARVGGKRLHDEAAHGRRQFGTEPLRKLRGAGDQRRRRREEIRLPLGSRLRPFRRHRRERVAHADQRGVLLDDGDRRRHDAQQRLVHRTQPHDAAGLLGGQQAARDELIDQRPPHRIAPLERLALDRHDGQRLDPAVRGEGDVAHEGGDERGQQRDRTGVEAGDGLLRRARDRGPETGIIGKAQHAVAARGFGIEQPLQRHLQERQRIAAMGVGHQRLGERAAPLVDLVGERRIAGGDRRVTISSSSVRDGGNRSKLAPDDSSNARNDGTVWKRP